MSTSMATADGTSFACTAGKLRTCDSEEASGLRRKAGKRCPSTTTCTVGLPLLAGLTSKVIPWPRSPVAITLTLGGMDAAQEPGSHRCRRDDRRECPTKFPNRSAVVTPLVFTWVDWGAAPRSIADENAGVTLLGTPLSHLRPLFTPHGHWFHSLATHIGSATL